MNFIDAPVSGGVAGATNGYYECIFRYSNIYGWNRRIKIIRHN